MTTTQADVLLHRQKGAWRTLEGIAAGIVADAEQKAGGIDFIVAGSLLGLPDETSKS